MGKKDAVTSKVRMVYVGRRKPSGKAKVGHLWYRVDGIESHLPLKIEEDLARRWFLGKHRNAIVSGGAGVGCIFEFEMEMGEKSQTVHGYGDFVGKWEHSATVANWEMKDKAFALVSQRDSKRAKAARERVSEAAMIQLNWTYHQMNTTEQRYFLAYVIQRITRYPRSK